MAENAHTIDTRIKKISIKEGKQPGVLVEINGVDTWLTQSLPQYFTGTPASALNEGDAVRITYKGTFLAGCDKLEPFEATAADLGPQEPTVKENLTVHRSTNESIQLQVSLKVASELVAAGVVEVKEKDPASVAALVGQMALVINSIFNE